MAHSTVARPAQFAETIKGSRFLAYATEVGDAVHVADWVDDLRRAHPDASHHCSAWRVGDRYGADDDGEPGGTAGRPMLEVLLKRDLDHVAVVCIRWFGGTKLGAGGLIRAYGGTTAKALDAAGVREVPDRAELLVHVGFEHQSVAHRLLDDWTGAAKGDATFTPAGVTIPATILVADVGAFRTRLADLTSGAATVEAPDASDDE